MFYNTDAPTSHSPPPLTSIGGLWAELPAWQTLQNDTGDFCLNVRWPPTHTYTLDLDPSVRLTIYMYTYIPPPPPPPPPHPTHQGFYTKRKTWFAADVCHMLEEYVRVSGIRPYVRLQQELVDQAWDKTEGEDGMWTLKARGGEIVWLGLCACSIQFNLCGRVCGLGLWAASAFRVRGDVLSVRVCVCIYVIADVDRSKYTPHRSRRPAGRGRRG